MSCEYIIDFINFAIQNEEEACALYESYAVKAPSAAQRTLLKEMAAMERTHAEKLKTFIENGKSEFSTQKIAYDLHIADFAIPMELSVNSSLEDIFIFSIQSEEKAYQLYTKLAFLETDEVAKKLFLSLAADEKNHKFNLETEYQKGISPEN